MNDNIRELIQKLDDNRFLIPKHGKMRVDGLVYANEGMLSHLFRENALKQVVNVATLPGIQGRSMAMPDIHWGYGFPIGGVAATDFENGVISPGGVGFDINCGVRLIRTDLMMDEVRPHIKELVNTLFDLVPSGLDSKGLKPVSIPELDRVLERGAEWVVEQGMGWESDLGHMEENGRMKEADAGVVSHAAKKRGHTRLGSLGAGNHFVEVQVVDEVYDIEKARLFGITGKGQVVVMVHTGSRSLGHQVCSDFLKVMERGVQRYGISLPDKQLACVPVRSPEGERYLKGMASAANFAWANRQTITHRVRKGFEKVFGRSAEELGMELVYDVAHNIAKIEEHVVDGKRKKVVVHRKGATRAFGPDHSKVPADYRSVGQPVLIPGDMGTSSYLLVGTDIAMEETFGSTCHGAGRLMSRREAVRRFMQLDIAQKLYRERGIYIKAKSPRVAAEEAPMAYKDVSEVVDVTHGAGISLRVARMRPLGVVKG
ncbi:MAG: RtcB family protein [Thermoplasmata archaeon]|nr:RtcB family protein [Thermoplasmata archaeon]